MIYGHVSFLVSYLDAVVDGDSQLLQTIHCVSKMTVYSHCVRRLCHRHSMTYLQRIQNVNSNTFYRNSKRYHILIHHLSSTNT